VEKFVRLHVIACEVLFREVCACAAIAAPTLDLTFMRRGLHSNPDTLRQEVQRVIDETDADRCDAVALAYGLCSNGLAGLKARTLPLVLPRAHDCITLLLGSKERYAQAFSARPGTYYYSGGWVERGADTVPRTAEDGAGLDAPFEELVEKYGLDNAQYLWEMQSNWISHYTHASYISTGVGDTPQSRLHTQEVARDHGWEYEEIQGSLSLLEELLNGVWDEDRFLVIPPGEEIVPCVGPQVVSRQPGTEAACS
jgi:hypothetical protein